MKLHLVWRRFFHCQSLNLNTLSAVIKQENIASRRNNKSELERKLISMILWLQEPQRESDKKERRIWLRRWSYASKIMSKVQLGEQVDHISTVLEQSYSVVHSFTAQLYPPHLLLYNIHACKMQCYSYVDNINWRFQLQI